MQKSRKITSKSSSIRTVPVMRPIARMRQPEVLRRQRNLRRRERAAERLLTLDQRLAMARAGERRRAGALLHQRRDRPLDAREQRRQAVAAIGRQGHHAGSLDRREVDLVHHHDVARGVPTFGTDAVSACIVAPPVAATASSTSRRRSALAARARARRTPSCSMASPAVAQARGVGQHHRPAAEIEMDLDDVARGAGGLRHDGRLAARQQIEQR